MHTRSRINNYDIALGRNSIGSTSSRFDIAFEQDSIGSTSNRFDIAFEQDSINESTSSTLTSERLVSSQLNNEQKIREEIDNLREHLISSQQRCSALTIEVVASLPSTTKKERRNTIRSLERAESALIATENNLAAKINRTYPNYNEHRDTLEWLEQEQKEFIGQGGPLMSILDKACHDAEFNRTNNRGKADMISFLVCKQEFPSMSEEEKEEKEEKEEQVERIDLWIRNYSGSNLTEVERKEIAKDLIEIMEVQQWLTVNIEKARKIYESTKYEIQNQPEIIKLQDRVNELRRKIALKKDTLQIQLKESDSPELVQQLQRMESHIHATRNKITRLRAQAS